MIHVGDTSSSPASDVSWSYSSFHTTDQRCGAGYIFLFTFLKKALAH